MPPIAGLTPRLVHEQLALLQAERRYYSLRLTAIAGDPDRQEELCGYLNLIDRINAACLRLARASGQTEGGTLPVQLAA